MFEDIILFVVNCDQVLVLENIILFVVVEEKSFKVIYIILFSQSIIFVDFFFQK